MEYILIENYVYTSVEIDGIVYRPDAIYTFCKNSKGTAYDGYYPPKINFYIEKHLNYPDAKSPVEGMFIIENKNIFDIFYNDLKSDPNIQVDFNSIPQNFKYEE